MDDLAGLSWTSSTPQSQSQKQASAPSNSNYFPTLRPTPPVSGRTTPANASTQSTANRAGGAANTKPSTPANDSFANLLPFSAGAQQTKSLSLQEQQRALEAQKAQKLGFGSGLPGRGYNASPQPRSTATSGRSTPNPPLASSIKYLNHQSSGNSQSMTYGAFGQHVGGGSDEPSRSSRMNSEKEEDLLAAFNASAPVDASTYFPAPVEVKRDSVSPGPSAVSMPSQANGSAEYAALDDDDPFGLSAPGPSRHKGTPDVSHQVRKNADDADDVLGLLGKPVSELPPRRQEVPSPGIAMDSSKDKALAELVDMGFRPAQSQEALSNTETGTDVQAAVGWLLNQAHAKSKKQAESPRSDSEGKKAPSASRKEHAESSLPSEEKDAAKLASELGSNFFKTANSLWKSSQKKFNKAVADFNADSDPSQPKWMVEARVEENPRRGTGSQAPAHMSRQQPARPSGDAGLIDMTDEARMLESGGSRPQPKSKAQKQLADPASWSSSIASRQLPVPARDQLLPRPSRRFVEDDAPQAYVSPARRKKAAMPVATELEHDLLSGGSQRSASAPQQQLPSSSSTQTKSKAVPRSSPLVTRPKAPPRVIPPISAIALKSSTSHRQKGNAAFKLGNYGEATEAYSASLQGIPSKHPLAVLLLTNRALTNLKTGDPKAAIADAESAIEIIGSARGADEEIDTGADEGKKPMGPFWGKAMMRRAEALEQLERWSDAARVWTECVQAGVGSAQSIQGRNRCERAAAPKPSALPERPAPSKKPAPKLAPRASALDELEGRSVSAPPASGAAVSRLRAANAAAEKADDEKFALADSVDARLLAWRKGKEGNLRALLGSLDTVLWESSGWKKVGMSELLQPNKVKVAYMKGIAKVHPDKLPTTATTEQVMISGAVFATLNEAWDKFKAENGL